MIYLDYAANSPVDEKVLDRFYDVTKKYFANPNSTHKLGLEAKKVIDDSTNNIAKNLGILPEEIIYTSGASESNNLVIKGICERYKNYGKHIISSKLEHNSIIAPLTVMQNMGFEVDLVDVDKDGKVDINEIKKLLREDTILVSIVAVDSELGIKQPIEEIGEILKDYPNCHFHTDASQATGKIDIDFTNVDLVTLAPHKFYGINGFGGLIKKKNVGLVPIINGGKSTTIYRSGTPVTASVAAFDLALDIALKNLKERNEYITKLNKIIIDKLKTYNDIHINSTSLSIPHTINFSVKGIKSEVFAKELEKHEIYVSTKASCCPGGTPSKSVYALTNDKQLALSSLRVSLSHLTTEEEVNKFLEIFDEVKNKLNGKI